MFRIIFIPEIDVEIKPKMYEIVAKNNCTLVYRQWKTKLHFFLSSGIYGLYKLTDPFIEMQQFLVQFEPKLLNQ